MTDRHNEMAKALAAAMRHPSPDHTNYAEVEAANAARIAAALRDECERCAKIAEAWKSPLRPGTQARLLGHQEAAREIAAAIRAGPGQQPTEKP
jgi:hypothetical protein